MAIGTFLAINTVTITNATASSIKQTLKAVRFTTHKTSKLKIFYYVNMQQLLAQMVRVLVEDLEQTGMSAAVVDIGGGNARIELSILVRRENYLNNFSFIYRKL